MCFSAQQSLLFSGIGLATLSILLWRGRSWKYVALTAYFTLMEVLQFLQYLVIDQCSSKLNQLLTMLAYIHVSCQPLVWNEFVFGLPQPAFNRPMISRQHDPILHWAVRRLSLAASLLLVLKGAPGFLQLLGLASPDHAATLQRLLGHTLASQLLGPATGCSQSAEMMCGPRLCSLQGRHHLGWSVPSVPHSYYVPTAALHGFFFFVPALVLGGPPQWALASAAFVTGPLLTELVLAGDAGARRHEWPALWCMFSLGQVLILFAVELVGTQLLFGSPHLPARDPNTTESLFSSLLPGDQDEAAQQQQQQQALTSPAAKKQRAALPAKLGSPADGGGTSGGASGTRATDDDQPLISPTPRRSARLRQRPNQ